MHAYENRSVMFLSGILCANIYLSAILAALLYWGLVGCIGAFVSGPIGLFSATIWCTLSSFVHFLFIAVFTFAAFALASLLLMLLRARVSPALLYSDVVASSSSLLLVVIPFVGKYLAMLLFGFSTARLLISREKTARVRTVLAITGTVGVVFAATYHVGSILGVTNSVGLPVSWFGRNTFADEINAGLIVDYLQMYSRNNQGLPPKHALEMTLAPTHFPAGVFCAASGGRHLGDFEVLGSSLQEICDMPETRRRATIDRVSHDASSYHEGIHCVGDCIFVYAGINMANARPGLWLVIVRSYDAGEFKEPQRFVVGRADRSIIVVPAGELEAAINDQNVLRASIGLEGIPYDTKILSDQ